MKKWSFIHIPKTGGTTIIKYLEQYINNTIHIDKNKVEDEEKYSLIFGHYNPNLYPDRNKIVWLRHPVDRVISNYLHLKYRMENTKKKFIMIDDNIRRFKPESDIISFTKETLHVYKFFTNNYNLKEFAYIGLQETMNESLQGLCSLLNIPFDSDKIGNYRSDQKPENWIITQEEKEIIRNMLKEDIDFYENIKKEVMSG